MTDKGIVILMATGFLLVGILGIVIAKSERKHDKRLVECAEKCKPYQYTLKEEQCVCLYKGEENL